MSVQLALIGRETEIHQFEAALGRASAGDGAILLVTGEGGAGKTVLLEHSVAQARRANIRSAWATVPDAEGAPPFWPWTAILRELGGDDPNNLLTSAAETLSNPDQAGGSPDQERFRIFDQVARALRGIGTSALVVIDDLHRADGGTLRLLEFLAPHLRHSRIVLVLGTRPAVAGADLAATFGALIHAGATRIDLRPWTAHEVAMVVRQCGLTTTQAVVDQLHHMTGGNPFFVLELARSAQQAGGPLDLSHVPPTVIDVLGAETRRLDPTQLGILRLAAAWGQGTPIEVLADAAGHAPNAVARSLPENFLSLDRDGAIWFRHDLVREAVYQGVPEHERGALHARLADAVERSLAAPDARARQVAVHGCRAGPAWKPDVAFTAALTAAREAGTIYAVESVAAYLALANAVRRWCIHNAARDLDFLVTYGDALTRAGHRNQAGPILAEATALARRLDDVQALARIALVVGLGTETAGAPSHDAWRLLDEALAKLPPDAHQLRSQLLSRRAWQALAASEFEQLTASAQTAVTEARAAGDPVTIAQALDAFLASTSAKDATLRQEIAREITTQATLANNIDLLFSGLLWEAHVGMETGDIPSTRRAAGRYRETSERWPLPHHTWYRWVLDAALAFLDQRLDDAASAIDQLDQATTTQREFASLLCITQRVELAARRGDRAAFDSGGATLLVHLERSPVYLPVRAHIDACLERHDSALQSLDQFMGALQQGPRDNDWLAGLVEAAFAAIRLGALPQAARLFTAIEPYRGRWDVIATATNCRGPISGVLAGLARLTGDADAATRFEAEAAADARRAGTPGALFWITGGPRWSPAEPRAAAAARLTDRELEVLALVAAGHSNQEIADRLVLSIRTVQRHVENIYAKTGARGRAAASVFATTQGLITPRAE